MARALTGLDSADRQEADSDYPLPGTPWLLVSALCALCLVSYLLGAISTSERAGILFAGCSLMLAGIAATQVTAQGSVSRSLASLRLGVWFTAAFAIVFGVSTVAVALGSGDANERIRLYITQDTALAAVPLLGFFLLVVVVGYGSLPSDWSRGLSKAVARIAGRERQSYAAPVVLLAIAVMANLLLLRGGILGYASDASRLVSSADPFTNVLSQLASLGSVVVFWMAWRMASTGQAIAALICIAAAASGFAWGIASGTKEGAVFPLLAAVLGWSGQRLRTNPALVLVLILVFVAIIYPLVSTYREAVSVDGGRLSPNAALGELADVRPDYGPSRSAEALPSRIARLGDFAVIHTKTPQIVAYRPASELLAAPLLGLVPRVVWPDKPVMSTGYAFAIEYYGQNRSSYSASAVTPEGDLYRHGGWLVMALGGFVLGWILRAVDSAAACSRDPRLYFLALLTFSDFVKHEKDWVTLVAGLPSAVAVFLLALWVSRQRIQ